MHYLVRFLAGLAFVLSLYCVSQSLSPESLTSLVTASVMFAETFDNMSDSQ